MMTPSRERLSVMILGRTTMIDRLVHMALARGVDTVIHLSAGLDTRPYRMDVPPSRAISSPSRRSRIGSSVNAGVGSAGSSTAAWSGSSRTPRRRSASRRSTGWPSSSPTAGVIREHISPLDELDRIGRRLPFAFPLSLGFYVAPKLLRDLLNQAYGCVMFGKP